MNSSDSERREMIGRQLRREFELGSLILFPTSPVINISLSQIAKPFFKKSLFLVCDIICAQRLDLSYRKSSHIEPIMIIYIPSSISAKL